MLLELTPKRVLIRVEYDGTSYAGWQRQSNALSIQAVIEVALSVLFQTKICLTGSGRTDSGVHALGQTAHFDCVTNNTAEKIMYALNSLLPDDIKIRECKFVSSDFHAQYSTKRKTYKYTIYLSNTIQPLKTRFAERVFPPLNIELIKQAITILLGTHDFAAFSAYSRSVKTTTREIYDVSIQQASDEISFSITGNGFLYKMVRMLVGALIAVGKQQMKIDDISKMLASGKRDINFKTLPAKGLCLVHVEYESALTDNDK
ncbi:MAG: tRNA pseudouridine(38-40) synthase TruA [Christensenellaceae bacterium]|jgi:tRNA pseudouridine38-40 synthase|nr:tRNA pseudouridine(38-40) synthase TruA [Christensenellaceae bacterium]